MQRNTKLGRLYERFYNAVIDLRFGAPLYGSVPTRYAHLGAHSTENSSYSSLKAVFKDRIRESDVLVDIGCGKGRVLNWWLSKGLRNRIIGIEIDEDIAECTRLRLRHFANVEILSGDAVEQLPEDATVVFLYNPFDEKAMYALKQRVKDILARRSTSKISLIYLNCKYLQVFENDAQCSIRRGHAGHPFAIIEISPVNARESVGV